ncbi:DNA repair protein RecN [Dokdonella sp.]|uniref:DNA repair protein RecN n=1 Tax=Dokdonella sp. TaxID=2291710 RepID=UPI003C6544AC
MLRSLYVKDFAIVGEAEIAFAAGLTVVTGETGAGKSLLVDALLMLSGNRADASLVRHGSERAELSAEFDLVGRKDLLEWLREAEFDDENACQLRRVIRSEGSSRAWINGRPVTLTQLKALGDRLIEIHGQHEHQALLDRSRQLAMLDAYGAHSEALARVQALAVSWRKVMARIKALSGGQDHAERMDWLSHQVDELSSHAIEAGELHVLEDTHKRLANSGQLQQGCAGLSELLDGESEFSISRLVTRAHGESQRLAALDPALTPLAELLDAARIHIDESSDNLTRYQDSLDLDPERMAEIDAQLGKLHELSRKHRIPMEELVGKRDELQMELDALRNAGADLQKLEQERRELSDHYAKAAMKLAAARKTAASRLGQAVGDLLADLGMAGGRFEVELEALPAGDPDPQGTERCEFMVSANPGQPVRALRKVASGGELSRISLAIEVAALGMDEVGTMVFDEVDAGIGGAVAEVVGQKLRRLGSQRQVLCVTHLAQVAAQGHAHLRVSKASEADSTETRIENLDATVRRDEIARMLGGIDITRETQALAKQMLREAQNTA